MCVCRTEPSLHISYSAGNYLTLFGPCLASTQPASISNECPTAKRRIPHFYFLFIIIIISSAVNRMFIFRRI